MEIALNQATGAKDGECRVGSLRPMRDGNQAVTVVLRDILADGLLKTRKLKIGWTYCQVRERMSVQRCYKCLEIGHSGKYCRGPDRSDSCFNCGQKGHKATGCNNAPHCMKCNVEGHRPDSIKCPSFKKALQTRGLIYQRTK